MGSASTVYVLSNADPSRAESAAHSAFPTAALDAEDGLCTIELSELPEPKVESELLKLSRDLDAEIYWIAYHSVVDAFQFHHWKSGRQLRSLVYGCYREERTWERVEGAPEPWEKAILFDPMELSSRLPFYDNPDDRTRLESIWREHRLLPGQDEPSLIAEDCAARVTEALGLL